MSNKKSSTLVQSLPNFLSDGLSVAEIWKLLHKTAMNSAEGWLRLGLILAQILREKPYQKLGVQNFEDLCVRLGISDRKGRHLVLFAAAWHDATELLGENIAVPTNFSLAERIFSAREVLAPDLYVSFLQRLYVQQDKTSVVERDLLNVLDTLRREHFNEFIAGSRDLKTISNLVVLAGVSHEFCSFVHAEFQKFPQNEKSEVVQAIGTLIETIESELALRAQEVTQQHLSVVDLSIKSKNWILDSNPVSVKVC